MQEQRGKAVTGQNGLEANNARRILAVAESEKLSFRDLAIEGGFDLAKDFRFSNLSDLSFAGEDLRDIDFSGANLCGCDFSNALIDGACFGQARIGRLSLDQVNNLLRPRLRVVDFSKAKAVNPNRAIPSNRKSLDVEISDDHLPAGVVFQDSLTSPEMIVLPTMTDDNGIVSTKKYRIAISRHSVGRPAQSSLIEAGEYFDMDKSKELKSRAV